MKASPNPPTNPPRSFAQASEQAIGLALLRPKGLPRSGWAVAGQSEIPCSECPQRLGVIYHVVSVVVLCRGCRESWSLKDYDVDTNARVRKFIAESMPPGPRPVHPKQPARSHGDGPRRPPTGGVARRGYW